MTLPEMPVASGAWKLPRLVTMPPDYAQLLGSRPECWELPIDSAQKPKELPEIVWWHLGQRQTFYFDFDWEKKEVYIKADNLIGWGGWVISELNTVDWNSIRALGSDITAKLEVKWEESWHFGGKWGSYYSDVPDWALLDVIHALVDNGFRAIDYVDCETGEVRRRE